MFDHKQGFDGCKQVWDLWILDTEKRLILTQMFLVFLHFYELFLQMQTISFYNFIHA